jgi:hypothetical protein
MIFVFDHTKFDLSCSTFSSTSLLFQSKHPFPEDSGSISKRGFSITQRGKYISGTSIKIANKGKEKL